MRLKTVWHTWQTEISYGLLIVGVTLLLAVIDTILITIYQNILISGVIGYIALAVPIIGYWVFFRQLAIQKKALTWNMAWKSGAVIALTVGVVGGVINYLYVLFVPQPIDLYVSYLQEQFVLDGLSPEEIQQALQGALLAYTPWVSGIASFIGSLIEGIILIILITPIQRWRIKHLPSEKK